MNIMKNSIYNISFYVYQMGWLILFFSKRIYKLISIIIIILIKNLINNTNICKNMNSLKLK